jgi:sugar/nucleoside kinase (ribokinase family)
MGAGIEIAVLGHILNEKIVFPDRVIQPVLGSPVAYSSVCMAKLGVSVGVVTAVGPDFPQSLLRVFQQMRVSTEGLKVGRRSTSNELIYDQDGYKTLRYLSRADPVRCADIPESYRQARISYVCPMDHEVSLREVENLSRRSEIMAVDLGGYGGGTTAIHPTRKDGGEVQALCPYFAVVKASSEDCLYIFGEGHNGEKEVGEKILRWGARICVITLGERGSYVRTAHQQRYVPALDSTAGAIVDQTGAGDCYSAGFLAHYLRSEDPFASAVYATATASYVIESSGGVVAERMPDAEEVQRRVRIVEASMQSD